MWTILTSRMVCVEGSFVPAQSHEVRWLDVEEDFGLLRAFHVQRSPDELYTLADACKWRDAGFTDAAVIEGGVVVARAARWTYSDDVWELAGVFTVPERRGAGLSRSVCSFCDGGDPVVREDRFVPRSPNEPSDAPGAESLGYTLVT